MTCASCSCPEAGPNSAFPISPRLHYTGLHRIERGQDKDFMGTKKPNRRQFLVAGSSAAFIAAVPPIPSGAESRSQADALIESADRESRSYSAAELIEYGPQRTFSGDKATQVAMPIGGIGTGCICVNGSGGIQDFSIRTRPETTALPSGFTSNSPEAAFAILHIKGPAPAHQTRRGAVSAVQNLRPGTAGAGLAPRRFRGISAI